MTVNAINGTLLSALSAVDGVSLSTLSAINGQALAPTSAPSSNNIVFMANAELESAESQIWNTSNNTAPDSGVTGAHGKVYDLSSFADIIDFPATVNATCRFRLRFRVNAADTVMSFKNGATVFHVSLLRDAGGTLSVNAPFGTHTTTSIYAIDTWYEIELKVSIHDSAGSYRLKVDGVVPNKSGGGTMDQSGLDTRSGTSTTTTNRIQFTCTTIDGYLDDVVIDTNGADLGLGEVETLTCNGDGNYTQLTPNTGSNHFDRVNELPQDGDTTYVQSNGANQRDSYTFSNRSLTGTGKAVMLIWRARATAGSPTVTPFIRIAGVDYDGSAEAALGGSFVYQYQVWNNNPATGNAWTDTEINALEAGLLCSATGARITQFAALIFVAS